MSDPEKEHDLRDVIAEETKRGTAKRVKAQNLELRRRIDRVLAMLRNPACTRVDFINGLREAGLSEDSEKFRECVKIWDAWRPA